MHHFEMLFCGTQVTTRQTLSPTTAHGQRVRVDTRQRTPRLARVGPVVPHGTRVPVALQMAKLDVRDKTTKTSKSH